jgi:hypothetical protein
MPKKFWVLIRNMNGVSAKTTNAILNRDNEEYEQCYLDDINITNELLKIIQYRLNQEKHQELTVFAEKLFS